MALQFVKGRSTETEGQRSDGVILNLGYNHTQYIFLTNEDAGKVWSTIRLEENVVGC